MDKHNEYASKHIKKLPSPQPNNETKQHSKTNVNIKLKGKRDVISIRCKREVKEAFTKFCFENGLTTCHIFEALTTAFLVGLQQKISDVYKSPTINLTLVREVKKLRRVGRDYDVEGNCFDVRKGWFFVEDAVLNVNGHAFGCACSDCREVKKGNGEN